MCLVSHWTQCIVWLFFVVCVVQFILWPLVCRCCPSIETCCSLLGTCVCAYCSLLALLLTCFHYLPTPPHLSPSITHISFISSPSLYLLSPSILTTTSLLFKPHSLNSSFLLFYSNLTLFHLIPLFFSSFLPLFLFFRSLLPFSLTPSHFFFSLLPFLYPSLSPPLPLTSLSILNVINSEAQW